MLLMLAVMISQYIAVLLVSMGLMNAELLQMTGNLNHAFESKFNGLPLLITRIGCKGFHHYAM